MGSRTVRAVAELVLEAQVLGATFELTDDTVRIAAPQPLPDGLMAELRHHKPEIVKHLRRADFPVDVGLPGVWVEAKDALAIICPACAMNSWWPRPDGRWTCNVCHPRP